MCTYDYNHTSTDGVVGDGTVSTTGGVGGV